MKAANQPTHSAVRGRTDAAHLLRRAPAAPRCSLPVSQDPRLTASIWFMAEVKELAESARAKAKTDDDDGVRDAGVPRVLLIDKDPGTAKVMSALLTPEARVTHAATLAQAQQLLRSDIFALIIIDPALPDGNAASLMPLIVATPVLVHAVREPAWRDLVAAFLPKPWTSQRSLWSTISRLLGVPTNMSAGD
ncbi:hypothetical protein [Massilia soli]|uniref:Response regulatory domain-containing protein n=1 Tax=Massilia soli TaxID=2792854 RepID=A0ABS7SSJ0_9BURK|nr:hypothetical protein [Massilia soli]MBZ2208914.1 hypothetical protein [Massilia soli]